MSKGYTKSCKTMQEVCLVHVTLGWQTPPTLCNFRNIYKKNSYPFHHIIWILWRERSASDSTVTKQWLTDLQTRNSFAQHIYIIKCHLYCKHIRQARSNYFLESTNISRKEKKQNKKQNTTLKRNIVRISMTIALLSHFYIHIFKLFVTSTFVR